MQKNLYQTKSLAAVSTEALTVQTRSQCIAVEHLSKVLAGIFRECFSIIEKQPRGVIEIQCARSAEVLETLGDILNEMDAFDEKEDAWTKYVFDKAQKLFTEKQLCN